MTPEKPEPNAYWHEKHGWITGLPSVNDPDYGKELNAKVKGLDKQAKDADKNKALEEDRVAKMSPGPSMDPKYLNPYSAEDANGDVMIPADTCNTSGRSGSFTHGNRGCGCTGC